MMTTDKSVPANILIVDDNPQILAFLTTLLSRRSYEVRTAINGSLALGSAQKRVPDLILLDVMMPDLDGYQVCKRLKADECTRDVPVIFLSALDGITNKVKAFSAGGVDYISKPFQVQEVLARVKTHLALRRAQNDVEEKNTQLQKLAHDVGERVKELNCLYGISELVETPGISLEEIVQGAAELIPLAWQYPEIACARIILEEQEFKTDNFGETIWGRTSDIVAHSELVGTVEVYYLQERPQSDGGHFLEEERDLINAIARRLGMVVERQRAGEEIARLARFPSENPNPVLRVAGDSTILYANAASALMLSAWNCQVGQSLPDEWRAFILDAISSGSNKEAETDCGDRVLSLTFAPVVDTDTVNIYGLDITERKRTEERAREHEVRLAALAERERIGRELHDDLAQVIGYLNVQAHAATARLEQGQKAQAQAILGQLARVAQEAHAGVRQYILGIRRPTTTGIVPDRAGDLFAALNRYLDTLRQRYGLEVRVSLPDDLLESPLAPEVETQLLRIIQEALTNVGVHAAVDTAQILFTLHADEIQVVIEDDGCGFDLKVGIRDWELGVGGKGESVGEDVQGAQSVAASRTPTRHFGLRIMRERAESVGGGLEVRSAPGEGTRVIVRLPLSVALCAKEGLENGVRVLLVDDHPLYLEGLRTLLSARGMQVVGTAHNGLEAQEQARALRPDLILMDVQMPGCDGVEATRRIKAEMPEIKIVMLTIDAKGGTLFEALKSGASGYLLKSLDGAKFFALLADAMQGETVLSPALANLVLAELARKPRDERDESKEATTLTPRQQEVLELVTQGKTNQEIASALYVSEATVKYHVSQILERLHLQSRHQMAQYAQERGLAPASLDDG